MGATPSLAHRGSLDTDHILYDHLSGSSDTRQVRLRSRRSFVPPARNLLDNLARLDIRASEWTNHKWKTEYSENASRLRAFVPQTGARPVGMCLPRADWVKLKRLRTGVGRFRSCTNGVSLLHRIASVAPLTNRRPCYNSVFYTSGTTWSTWSDGFE